jgi:hypothetical protein
MGIYLFNQTFAQMRPQYVSLGTHKCLTWNALGFFILPFSSTILQRNCHTLSNGLPPLPLMMLTDQLPLLQVQ